MPKFAVTRIYTSSEYFTIDAENAEEAEILAADYAQNSDGSQVLENLEYEYTVVEDIK